MAVGDELLKARGIDPTSGSVSQEQLSSIFPDYGINSTYGYVDGNFGGSFKPSTIKIPNLGRGSGGASTEPGGSEPDYSGGFLGDTRERNAANNYGYIDRSLALELASSAALTGPFSLGGKMVGLAINGNNVYAVNAARAEMGLEPLTAKEAMQGLVKDRQGIVAEVQIGNRTYAVGLEAKTPNGRTTLTPTEARQRSLISQNKVVEAPKGTFEKKEKAALRDPTITSQAGIGTQIKGAAQRAVDHVLGRDPVNNDPKAVSPAYTAPTPEVERSPLAAIAPEVDLTPAPQAPQTAQVPTTVSVPDVPSFISPVEPTTQVPQASTVDTSRGIFSPEFSPPSTPSTPNSVTSVPEIEAPSLVAPEISPSFTPDFGTPTQIDGFEPFTVFEPGNSLGNITAPANDIGTRDYGLSFYNPGQEKVSQAAYNAGVGVANEMGRDIGVTSGYRSPSHNEKVGGANSSLHTHGRAMDVDLRGMSPAERQSLVEQFTQRGASGFITYTNSPNMLHVDFGARPAGDRGTIDRSKNPIEAPHFMHDRSQANMGKAPDWFQEAAKYGGLISLTRTDVLPEARPNINANTPMASMTPQVEQKAPQNAFNQGFIELTPQTPATNPGTIGVLSPNQQVGPTTKDIYGWERPQEVRDLMALTISGELGSKTLQGILSNDPEMQKQARQEIAAIASTIDNRAFSSRYSNPADPRTSYLEVLNPKDYNSLMPSNMGTTNKNYNDPAIREFVTQALVDYDLGVNPSPVPDATHYRSTGIAAPAWEPYNQGLTVVGQHVFADNVLTGDRSRVEYDAKKNNDAFTSFTPEPAQVTDIPDEVFNSDFNEMTQIGFSQPEKSDKELSEEAMSFNKEEDKQEDLAEATEQAQESYNDVAMAGTLGSGSLLDEPIDFGLSQTQAPQATSTEPEKTEEEESEAESTQETSSEGPGESSPGSESQTSSSATGMLSDEGKSGVGLF